MAKTVFANGTVVSSAFLNAVQSHDHDGADNDGHAPKLEDTNVYGTVPVGAVVPYVGTEAPANWLVCDGSAFSGETYPALAALLGGTSTPNLKGKFVVGYDSADTDYDTIGETGGTKTHTLTVDQIPSHNHGGTTGTEYPASGSIDQINPDGAGNYYPRIDAAHNHSISSQGGGQAHENRPPFVTLCWIIRAR